MIPEVLLWQIIHLVVTIGHNKSCPVSGYKRSLVGPEGQPEIS